MEAFHRVKLAPAKAAAKVDYAGQTIISVRIIAIRRLWLIRRSMQSVRRAEVITTAIKLRAL